MIEFILSFRFQSRIENGRHPERARPDVYNTKGWLALSKVITAHLSDFELFTLFISSSFCSRFSELPWWMVRINPRTKFWTVATHENVTILKIPFDSHPRIQNVKTEQSTTSLSVPGTGRAFEDVRRLPQSESLRLERSGRNHCRDASACAGVAWPWIPYQAMEVG